VLKKERPFLILICLVLPLVLGMIYQPAISWLFSAWLNNEYYNHGLLLLPVSALLILHKRSEIYRAAEPELRHLIPLGAGFALYVGGVFLHQPTLFCCSLLLVAAGLALLFLGSGAKPLLFPIFLFATAIPIPGFDRFAIPLQNLSALASSLILDIMGLPVSMDGNFVNLAGNSYWIAPACSGLNRVMPLFALTAIFVYLADGSTI
jgi:exosortase